MGWVPNNPCGRARRFLAPSKKYEIWLQLVRQEVWRCQLGLAGGTGCHSQTSQCERNFPWPQYYNEKKEWLKPEANTRSVGRTGEQMIGQRAVEPIVVANPCTPTSSNWRDSPDIGRIYGDVYETRLFRNPLRHEKRECQRLRATITGIREI